LSKAAQYLDFIDAGTFLDFHTDSPAVKNSKLGEAMKLSAISAGLVLALSLQDLAFADETVTAVRVGHLIDTVSGKQQRSGRSVHCRMPARCCLRASPLSEIWVRTGRWSMWRCGMQSIVVM